jgi:hypothetical protein
MPHGDAPLRVTTARAAKSRSPSLTALKVAVRSAQTVAPNDAISTFQPVKIAPDVVSSAAPTA